jgi:transketolase
MRSAFFEALFEGAARDPRIFLLTGDLGFGVVERFARAYPDRFINAGIAEQNMTGVATGLALAGKIVFTYSIANFPTLRCLEQIRNGPCYHGANVKIVSVGAGVSYGSLGMSHHATEDLAILRALPEMTVLAPGDPMETRLAVAALIDRPGPAYLRLGRSSDVEVYPSPPTFSVGRAIGVREGRDLTLIATGTMLATAVMVATRLQAHGVAARVLSMHTVSPIDAEAIRAAAMETRLIATIEEHSITGGLGGAVAEVLAECQGRVARLRRFGLPASFIRVGGSREYLCKIYGLTPEAIGDALLAMVMTPVERTYPGGA